MSIILSVNGFLKGFSVNNKERGERIRRQIVSDVRHHPTDISKHIATIFSITVQAVNSHIRRLENEGWLTSTGTGKGKRYFLGDLREHKSLFPLSEALTEDGVWRNQYFFIFEDLPENIVDICHYGFTEMVNNVIDHSGGKHIYISARRDKEKIMIFVLDDGEGIFRKIKRLCDLDDERQALFELSKGKLTTDPDNHTGEGIFFTSRVFDEFEIDSKGVKFSHDDQFEFDYILETEFSKNEAGTSVYMLLNRDSDRNIQTVFDDYAGPDEFQFNKTVIPVRLAQYGNEKLVSRSQAKRLLTRIERFQNVIFDFEGVSAIGQAFADEIFRVYANNHPGIILLPVNMEANVKKMVNRAVSAV
jgi:anti-sigma regulatory factor (Ser/Thr protein kinase)